MTVEAVLIFRNGKMISLAQDSVSCMMPDLIQIVAENVKTSSASSSIGIFEAQKISTPFSSRTNSVRKFGAAKSRDCRSVGVHVAEASTQSGCRNGITLRLYHNDSAATQTDLADAARRGVGLWHL
jgi:hypothetical protein